MSQGARATPRESDSNGEGKVSRREGRGGKGSGAAALNQRGSTAGKERAIMAYLLGSGGEPKLYSISHNSNALRS